MWLEAWSTPARLPGVRKKSVCAVVDGNTSQGAAAGEETGNDGTQSKVWSCPTAVLAMMVRYSW